MKKSFDIASNWNTCRSISLLHIYIHTCRRGTAFQNTERSPRPPASPICCNTRCRMSGRQGVQASKDSGGHQVIKRARLWPKSPAQSRDPTHRFFCWVLLKLCIKGCTVLWVTHCLRLGGSKTKASERKTEATGSKQRSRKGTVALLPCTTSFKIFVSYD